ncbi:hypothetical protein LTR66_001003 [Elasticomyces elasticus]|nr:hypothetical protein LTR50_005232 [Elasticomyces elasticus]KAK5000056.1 hypothetical protein LTR66_001003 [Elasticomyces elasticus]
MPPRAPLPATGLNTAWQCPSCTRRAFSTTACRPQIGPESPKYITIPEPPQQTSEARPYIKGILPVPRNIFRGTGKGRGLDRLASLPLATKEPTSQYTPVEGPEGSRIAWKQRMAASRRQNLREGLETLKERRERGDERLRRRGLARQAERQALVDRPEREDERLTNPTLDKNILDYLNNNILPDPNREQRLQEMRARVAYKEAVKKSARSDALHTLYMRARSFITSPQALDKAIEDEFPSTASATRAMFNSGNSVWDQGKPVSIQDMLNRAYGQAALGQTALDSVGGQASLTNTRVRKMAEELTGGQMEDSEVR